MVAREFRAAEALAARGWEKRGEQAGVKMVAWEFQAAEALVKEATRGLEKREEAATEWGKVVMELVTMADWVYWICRPCRQPTRCKLTRSVPCSDHQGSRLDCCFSNNGIQWTSHRCRSKSSP